VIGGEPAAAAQTDELASIGQRAGGALVDGVLTTMVAVVPFLLGLIDADGLEAAAIVAGVFLFGAVYAIVPTALWGQTVGKVAIGTRVVAEEDGSLPGWRRATIRWALPGLVAWLPNVGLWVSLAVMATLVLDPRRRGVHDRLAGTIVVRVPR
jgi:uncharacterized RDD family membrane protein YckC